MLSGGKLRTTDSKLVIYVQHEEPKNERHNWLRAPKGEFQFAARFYGPHGPVIAGSYNMPGVARLSQFVSAKLRQTHSNGGIQKMDKEVVHTTPA